VSDDLALKNESMISLSIEKNTLADIVVNFLGNKEKLFYEDECSYLLRRNDLEQFYYLVDEKIKKEHYIYINSFSVHVSYNDKTSRLINSIEELNRFLETRDVISESVTLTWNVILKYPDAENRTIENQKIELSFFKSDDVNLGAIKLIVEHTNQAWGGEILNLIKDKILDVCVEEPKIVRLSRLVLSKMTFGNYALVVLILVVILGLGNILNRVPEPNDKSILAYEIFQENYSKNEALVGDYEKSILMLGYLHISQVKEATDRLIHDEVIKKKLLTYYNDNIDTGIDYSEFFKIIFYFFVFPVVCFYFVPNAYLKRTINYGSQKCFVLVTPRSEKEYEKYVSDKNRIQYMGITAATFAIITSAIGSYFYNYVYLLF